MPTTIKLRLKLEEALVQGYHLGASTNAALLSLIQKKNPKLSAEMHDTNQNPYSLALEPDGGFGGLNKFSLEVRLHVLNDTLASELLATLKLGETFGTKRSPLSGQLINLETESESYSDLVSGVLTMPLQRSSKLEFLSSTCISGNGNTWALPIPSMILNGLRIRFEHFSSFAFEGSVGQYASRNLKCSWYQVEPQVLQVSSKEQHVGFVGTANFMAEGVDSSARVAALLLRFAGWSGVGVNTAFGCGQVRVKLERKQARNEDGEVVRIVPSTKTITKI